VIIERAFGVVSATRNIFNLAGHQGLHCALRSISIPPLHGGKGITPDESLSLSSISFSAASMVLDLSGVMISRLLQEACIHFMS